MQLLRSLYHWVRSRIRRLTGFGLVGGFVMVVGVALLGLLVEVLQVDPRVAYIVVAVISIESNFLLNRYFNWKDRAKTGSFWAQWRRFHAARVFTFPLNQILFNLLISLGSGWLLATLVGVVVTTVINFIGLDFFVFSEERKISPEALEIEALPVPNLSISVIIPAVNEQATVRACVESLLAQVYKPMEIILSTNRGDPTIAAIQDYVDQGLVTLVFFDRPADWVGRDTNMRRLLGLNEARGDILALTDAKIWAPEDWLLKIAKLVAQGEDAVAGITERMPGDKRFLSVMWDEAFFRENVRWNVRHLTPENFGRVNGLPVTANIAFTQQVLEAIRALFPVHDIHGWEDFFLSSVIKNAGFIIRTTNQVVTHRMHKVSLRSAKHLITGMAARQFILQLPDNEFAQRRHRLAVIITATQLAGLSFLLSIGLIFDWVMALYALLSLTVSMLLGLGVYNAIIANEWRALFFPPLVLYQIELWIIGYWISTILRGDIPGWLASFLKSLRIILISILGGGGGT
ncbi:GtrA family protein [candidate division WWE3 bacterium]|uniref:GtrA family protein n=1 Tax=candidate division WWE3 bacterium TaxID=2053526 RepID=A0A955LGQ2_UNCKA|nr:GtrA family protein [candidate division WWE3 bacterium]